MGPKFSPDIVITHFFEYKGGATSGNRNLDSKANVAGTSSSFSPIS